MLHSRLGIHFFSLQGNIVNKSLPYFVGCASINERLPVLLRHYTFRINVAVDIVAAVLCFYVCSGDIEHVSRVSICLKILRPRHLSYHHLHLHLAPLHTSKLFIFFPS